MYIKNPVLRVVQQATSIVNQGIPASPGYVVSGERGA